MNINKWTPEMDKLKDELIASGYTNSEIIEIINSEFGTDFKLRAIRDRRNYLKKTQAQQNSMLSTELEPCQSNNCNYFFNLPSSFEDKDWNEIQSLYSNSQNFNDIFQEKKEDYIDCTKSISETFNSMINTNKMFPEDFYYKSSRLEEKINKLQTIYNLCNDLNPKKVLVLSDLHIPDTDYNLVEKAIKDNKDADLCVLNGDVFDNIAFSKHSNSADFNFEEEFEQTKMFFEVLFKYFKHVVYVPGNHDKSRLEAFVSRNFPNGVKEYAVENLSLIQKLAKQYPNLHVSPTHYVQIGDVICSHLPNYSIVKARTLTVNDEIFSTIKSETLPNKNYRAILLGHTHQMSKLFSMDGQKLLIEVGCMCNTPEYKINRPTKTAWQRGYAVINFNNMKVDFNKTNFVFHGE